jgi:hypothetical protein
MMNTRQRLFQAFLISFIFCLNLASAQEMIEERITIPGVRKTSVSIVGDEFWINGQPTYLGQKWKGKKIEGLLLNTRMVQGIFDDRNTNTVQRWAYPDTARWDAERNTREFMEAMPNGRATACWLSRLTCKAGRPRVTPKSSRGLTPASKLTGR